MKEDVRGQARDEGQDDGWGYWESDSLAAKNNPITHLPDPMSLVDIWNIGFACKDKMISLCRSVLGPSYIYKIIYLLNINAV